MRTCMGCIRGFCASVKDIEAVFIVFVWCSSSRGCACCVCGVRAVELCKGIVQAIRATRVVGAKSRLRN